MKAPIYGAQYHTFKVNGVASDDLCNGRFVHRSRVFIGGSPGYPHLQADGYQYGSYFLFDSKAYRQVIEQPYPYALPFSPARTHTFRYCPRVSSLAIAFGHPQEPSLNALILPTTVVCLGEGPILDDLVVKTETDGLGDHDCGFYGETESARRQFNEQLRQAGTDLTYSSQPRSLAINLQFLVGGHTYTQLFFITSKEQLLNLFPVRQNTLVILVFGENETFTELDPDSGESGSGIEYHSERLKNRLRGKRAPRRLPRTDQLPDEIGQRDTVFSFNSADFGGQLPLTLAEPDAADQEVPALMLVALGSGVKIVLDATGLSQDRALFSIQGPVQIHNIDLEVQGNALLFELNHSLQLYRSSIQLLGEGRLARGLGLMNVSRSRLYEARKDVGEASGRSPEERLTPCAVEEPLIKACRSQVSIRGMGASPEQIDAMNRGEYQQDFLDRLERLLPRRPLEDLVDKDKRDGNPEQYLKRYLYLGDTVSRVASYGCLKHLLCHQCPDVDDNNRSFFFREQTVQGADQYFRPANESCGLLLPSGITHVIRYSPTTLSCDKSRTLTHSCQEPDRT